MVHTIYHEIHIALFMLNAGLSSDQREKMPHYARVPRLLMIQLDKVNLIAPSTVAQKHISQRENGSFPVSKVVELLNTAPNLGFGEMVMHQLLKTRGRSKNSRCYIAA